jgi:RNA-dependent RNA polymerase
LHSDAVDYPKCGEPVALSDIPKLHFRARPDWNAPETVNQNSADYYESQHAIGRLFREIDLPALKTVKQTSRFQHRQLMEDDEVSLDELFFSLVLDRDTLYLTVEERVQEFGIDTEANISEDTREIFGRYVSELRNICASHTLSHSKSAMLTEEEAIIGTIVAKSSQPRHRRNVMAKLRETTEHLVHGIRGELDGHDDISHEEQLGLAWEAWKLSIWSRERFGAKSFGWIALGQIFEAINAIEETDLRARYRNVR